MKEPPWFVICVKARHEKYVALALHGKGYEAFVPTYVKQHRHRRSFELPLFPGYVFTRLEPTKTLPILTIPGVFSIVCCGRTPDPVPEPEIERIRTLFELGFLLVPWPYVAAGQEVVVESGPLRGVQGLVVDATHDKWFVLSIHLLRRSVAVKVERESVRPALDSPRLRLIRNDGLLTTRSA